MGEFESFIFYIVLFGISSAIVTRVGNLYINAEYKNKKIKIIFLTIVALAIPITIGAFRYFVGADYENYIYIYENRSDMQLKEIFIYNWEILFSIIIKIAYMLNDYQYMFAIISFLTIIVLYATIYNYKEKLSLGFMFFLYLFLYYTTSFNIIRQALAVVIVAYSYKFIIDRNFKKFLLTVLIASFFHTTALLFLPFYLIYDKNEMRKKVIRYVYIFIALIVVFNYSTIINLLSQILVFEKYELYSIEVDSTNMDFILNLFLLFVIIIFRKPLIKYDSRNEIFIYFSIINVIFLLTGYFSPFVKRISLYFGISNIFLLSAFPQISKNKGQKLFIYFIVMVYAISYFSLTTIVLKQGNVIPYHTIFIR